MHVISTEKLSRDQECWRAVYNPSTGKAEARGLWLMPAYANTDDCTKKASHFIKVKHKASDLI